MDIKENLLTKSFRESKKPNLYYYNFGHVILFIDLREGKNYRCFFYKILDENNKFSDETKETINASIIKEYFLMNNFCKDNFNFKLRFMELYDKYNSGFKYECPICKSAILKDFGITFEYNYEVFSDYYNSQLVCSMNCYKQMEIKEKNELRAKQEEKVKQIMKAFEERKNFQCNACKKMPEIFFEDGYLYYNINNIKHHVDYTLENEKMVLVCPSCHAKITWHLDKHPKLKQFEPKGTRKEYLEKKNEEKLKRAEERAIKKKERLEKEAKKKAEIKQRNEYKDYSKNIKWASKNWYKRA